MRNVFARASGNVVQCCDLLLCADQGVGEVRADESRPPCNQPAHWGLMLQTGSRRSNHAVGGPLKGLLPKLGGIYLLSQGQVAPAVLAIVILVRVVIVITVGAVIHL